MKKLVIAERLAHVLIVLACINCIGETFVTYGGVVSPEEVQEDMSRSAIRNGGFIIIMTVFLFTASVVRSRKSKGD